MPSVLQIPLGLWADLWTDGQGDLRDGEREANSKQGGTGQGLAFWAVAIAARVVADALVAAGIALLDMAAERCRGIGRAGSGRPLLDPTADVEPAGAKIGRS